MADIVRLLERDKDVRTTCGFSRDNTPSDYAMGHFLKKVVRHEALLEECLVSLVERLRKKLPGFGTKLVVDSTDIKAYANGHRKNPSDADARWGAKRASHHAGGTQAGTEVGREGNKGKKEDMYYWFGYKLHLLVDGLYELPISYILTPANESDTTQMLPLLEKAEALKPENKPEAVIGDKGFDSQKNCRSVFVDYKAAPIIPIRGREGEQLPDICNIKGTPTCAFGLEMIFWGRDGNYLKYRCPQAVGKAKC